MPEVRVEPKDLMEPRNSLLTAVRGALDVDSSQRFLVAFSGGMDSHVLLHSLARCLGARTHQILAVHVDHGLQPGSAEWASRCLAMAKDLGVAISLTKVDEAPRRGESVEAWARRHRYQILKSLMAPRDALLTAHHRDDLAETLLIQLIRGAGPHGLASIPPCQAFGPGVLVRPLINVPRSTIAAYADAEGLDWIDDPSNASDVHDRNYIRRQVMPIIHKRWPSTSARFARAAKLQQEAATCLDTIADDVLASATTSKQLELSVGRLFGVSDELRRWVLRRWIISVGYPIPDSAHLLEIEKLLNARQDAIPCVSWKGVEMRRYREKLFLSRVTGLAKVEDEHAWDFRRPLSLQHGVLSAEACAGTGLNRTAVADANVIVRYRRGGERCHPSSRVHSQSLKRLFQEWGIEPWKRATLPLVFVEAELAAVADICVSKAFVASGSDEGWKLVWRPHANLS